MERLCQVVWQTHRLAGEAVEIRGEGLLLLPVGASSSAAEVLLRAGLGASSSAVEVLLLEGRQLLPARASSASAEAAVVLMLEGWLPSSVAADEGRGAALVGLGRCFLWIMKAEVNSGARETSDAV